ncbi:MAG: ABC transporter ATP-binding protein [Candidatus Cloacimonetes bacterium]|nr:ABC transporter ATP-binding protein [Candidatus Cloacimonadota bacterium]MBL7085766.1 ABC transporter ATP-binding protein [Candidatus Cloacimonadota bacterium]
MIIKAEKITKTYFEGSNSKKLVVLNELDFEMDKGNIISITGLSGSGKSTLLHILGTLDKPDKGEIFFNEININKFSENKLSRFRNQNIGFVFQFHHLLPEITALENVAMPKLISGETYSTSLQAAENLLSELDLLERKDHYPNQLSGGEQQRIAVARALINNPELILADEPTGNLDKYHSEELLELLWDLNKKFSTSLLLVTHNEDLAKKADIVYQLIDGKLLYKGKPSGKIAT